MPGKRVEYAVVDVETTGLGENDRVVEIGVVVLDHRFCVVDEYETLVNPGRDLGATHIHGITPSMVSLAPTFAELAPGIAKRIENRVFVAHNSVFDQRMLRQEFARVNATFDPGIGFCTLRMTGHKLPIACQSLGIDPPAHHRALADARAAASILKALAPRHEVTPVRIDGVLGKNGIRTYRRCADANTPVMNRLLSRVVYDEEDARLLEYMDLLDWVLDDLVVTEDERKYLDFLAEELQLSPDEVSGVHDQYFRAMVNAALKTGMVTPNEHAALSRVAVSLGIPADRVPPISAGYCQWHEIPPGTSICFTGSYVGDDGNRLSKSDLAVMATRRGFTVVESVTRSKCDLVVAIDPTSASGKAKKAREYDKPILATKRFLELLG
jgi:DNA polymerase III subunit epsilon